MVTVQRATGDPGLPAILSVAYPYAPVGAGAVGGAEVILSQIEAGLPSMGFRSVVVAHAGSRPQGQHYPTRVPAGEITEALRAEVEQAQQQAIDCAIAENPVVLVHMHGLDFHRYRLPLDMPVLVTLHLPPAWYPESIWSLPANYRLVCVSQTQREACPEAVRNRIDVVANGVPLPAASMLREEGKYALMMARICAEKNLHTGFEAARLAGMPAMLAGEVFPYEAHQRYFREMIEPRLTRAGTGHQQHAAQAVANLADARFLGPVTGQAKARLLARAACLLVPSLAPETSSLVAMEALAAGVPVIAMASGAVPEIVDEGRTGFLLDSQLGSGPEAAQAMAEAVARLPAIDRRNCRAVAEQRFGLPRMLEAYGSLYRRYAVSFPSQTTLRFRGAASLHEENVAQEPARVGRVQHLSSLEQLSALGPAWTRLWQSDPRATPFQHPAWLFPWWRQFGPDGELQTLALHADDGGLLAFVPLYIYREPDTGRRQLLLLGAGTSDYLDGLFGGQSHANPLAAQAFHYVSNEMPCWDTLNLTQLRADSPLLMAANPLREVTVTEAEPCSVIDVQEDLPAKVRANAGRYRRRAERAGTLRCTAADTDTEALANFEHLQRFHRSRWDDRAEPGVLTDPRVVAHHREAIPLLLAAGLLRFFRLMLDDTVLGVIYTLVDPPQHGQRKLYLYLIGFDLQFAELSPGTLLLHEVWLYARREGFATLDLLRGGEQYKQLWGARTNPTFALHANAPALP